MHHDIKKIDKKLGSNNQKIAKIEMDQNLCSFIKTGLDKLRKKTDPNDQEEKKQRDRYIKHMQEIHVGINKIDINFLYDINNAINENIADIEKNKMKLAKNLNLDEIKKRLIDFRHIQTNLK